MPGYNTTQEGAAPAAVQEEGAAVVTNPTTINVVGPYITATTSGRTVTLTENQYLGKLVGANMNSTADQTIAMCASKYVIRRIVVTNASVNLTLAAGGIYPATSKGGTAIVANTQLFSALTAATISLDLTVVAGALVTALTGANIYLSLTTAQGSAATCDIYVFGDALV